MFKPFNFFNLNTIIVFIQNHSAQVVVNIKYVTGKCFLQQIVSNEYRIRFNANQKQNECYKFNSNRIIKF